MSIKEEKLVILKYLNTIIKRDCWGVVCLTKDEDIVFSKTSYVKKRLYEIKFNGQPIIRGFCTDIFQDDKVFFSLEWLLHKLKQHQFINIKCQLIKK